jgi:HD superfamily phosphohydrolase
MIIRDPVHGDIYFGDRKDNNFEKEVIETKQMQRLRGIKQLGTAYLVYPGATHTRFEQSLGTAHLVKIIMDNVHRNGYRIDENLREAISIAGLLHDVSHIPFGHTFEDERWIFKKHDSRIEQFLHDNELCDVLENLTMKFNH